jgi:fructose-1-phosphate kinase PfkB-like protein
MLASLLDGEGMKHQVITIAGLIRESLTIFKKSTGQQYCFGLTGPTPGRGHVEEYEQYVGAGVMNFPVIPSGPRRPTSPGMSGTAPSPSPNAWL